MKAKQIYVCLLILPVNRKGIPLYLPTNLSGIMSLFHCPNGRLLLYLLLSPYPTSKTICSPRRLLKIKSVELQYLIFEKSNKVENEKKI